MSDKPRKSRVPLGHRQKTWLYRVQTATDITITILGPGGWKLKVAKITRSVIANKLAGG